jgi:hypothetical protein
MAMTKRRVLAWLVKAAPLFGALVGVGRYLRALFRFGRFEYQWGADSASHDYVVINRPAKLLAQVWSIPALAPQYLGWVPDPTGAEHWSLAGFIALGLAYYALCGFAIGMAIRAVFFALVRFAPRAEP